MGVHVADSASRQDQGHHSKALFIQKSIGHERMNVGVEVEVFAKGGEGEGKGRSACGEAQGRAEDGGDDLLGDDAEAPEETAMAMLRTTKGTKHTKMGVVDRGAWA